MSLPRDREQGNLFEVGLVLASLFEHRDRQRFQFVHDRVMPALWKQREKLEGMYCHDNGRPAIDPVFLAGVTLLQFMERTPDAKAAEQVVLNLGWKCALGLPLEYDGFHPTTLVVFRARLVEKKLERVLFDAVLGELRGQGLIRKRCKQRLDSTHIVGLVSTMGTLECVRETLRLALEAVERTGRQVAVPDWLRLQERYCESQVVWREQSKEQLRAKLVQAGLDAAQVVAWWAEQQQHGRDLPAAAERQLALLKQVLEEQYEEVDGELQPRKQKLSGTIANPHDVDAQWATKDNQKKTAWTGFKGQVVETVPDDPTPKDKGEPTEEFVTEITTTEAIASDLDGMDRALQNQEAQGQEPPSELFVDAAYVTANTLHEARERGTELVGPARPSKHKTGRFPSERFQVDTASRTAICPAGHRSTQCSLIQEGPRAVAYYRFEWSHLCDNCPLQSECTDAKNGRRTLNAGLHHDLLQARRREMKTPGFQRRMNQRNAGEGTISELKRGYGFGRSRYRGLAKNSLANYCLGASCNVNRWWRRSAWESAQEAALAAAA